MMTPPYQGQPYQGQPHQGQPHQGQPYQGQPQYPMAPPATVWGVPLEPGERVLYYAHPSGTGDRVMTFIAGIIFLVLVFGLVFLYLGIFYEKHHDRVYVITDRRVMTISGTKKARTVIRLQEIKGIRRITGAKNQFIVDGRSDFIIFRFGDHNLDLVGHVLQSLPRSQALPAVPHEV